MWPPPRPRTRHLLPQQYPAIHFPIPGPYPAHPACGTAVSRLARLSRAESQVPRRARVPRSRLVEEAALGMESNKGGGRGLGCGFSSGVSANANEISNFSSLRLAAPHSPPSLAICSSAPAALHFIPVRSGTCLLSSLLGGVRC